MTVSVPGGPHVGIIGAGIQGICAALALADRGARVTVLERADRPMTGASLWNEGKLHLGLVYGKDTSQRTIVAMARAALAFMPFLTRYIDQARFDAMLSGPLFYGVHRDSMLDPSAVATHFGACRRIFREVVRQTGWRYPLLDDDLPIEPLAPAEADLVFDPGQVRTAFRTGERSINPHRLAEALASVAAGHPRIAFHFGTRVDTVELGSDGRPLVRIADDGPSEAFDHLVNAAWEDRLRLDASLGLEPPRPWIHRYKVGIRGHWHGADDLPSATLVLGPFGDVVNFGGGEVYLSWYPACMLARSEAIAPGWLDAPPLPVDPACIVCATRRALAAIVPRLEALRPDGALTVGGGAIFAWGSSDIDDPASRLHTRHDTGVESHGRYHTVNTGKYTMGPLNALDLVARILGARAQVAAG